MGASRKLTMIAFALLFGVNASDPLVQKDCHTIFNSWECMKAENDDFADRTKCLPVKKWKDGRTCASWRDIQRQDMTLDFDTNHNDISEKQKQSVKKLEYFTYWAQYTYEFNMTKPELQDMQKFEYAKDESLLLMGYDPDSNSIVTAFRGTSNFRNLMMDLQINKVPYYPDTCKNCDIHKGFYDSFMNLKDNFSAYLQNLMGKYPLAKIVITGHSLGGATAVLAAIHASTQMSLYVDLYTYGQPRVGDANFTNYQNSVIKGDNLRATFDNDPIACLPPAKKLLQFSHGGTEVHFYECGNTNAYMFYQFNTDNTPLANFLQIDDHMKYKCIVKHDIAKQDPTILL